MSNSIRVTSGSGGAGDSIAKAMESPSPLDPEVTRMEFDMKDQMIRATIMETKADVDEMKKTLERIEDKLYKR